jgi:myosin-crossreactive antigen
MSIESILAQIDAEIAQLTKVRDLLATNGATSASTGKVSSAKPAKPGKRRVLSAEARKRIADAQRRRWAAQKAKTK